MARPVKAKRICAVPVQDEFGPLDGRTGEPVIMTLEEYEAIRLIDLLDCTQEECAVQMGVARTTVQAVYNSARKKLAEVLVNGCQLKISGGSYEICPDSDRCCGRNCRRHACSGGRCGRRNKENGGCNHEDCRNL